MLAAVSLLCLSCRGAGPVQEGTDPGRIAAPLITAGRLEAAVSFLADDVLEGRAAPSRGLRVAQAYVAARFRGAGLEGLGPGGSFYLSFASEARRTAEPTLRAGGTPEPGPELPVLGLLAPPEKTWTAELRPGSVELPLVAAPQPRPGRMPAGYAALFALAARARLRAARAVLVRTPRAHPLARLAARARRLSVGRRPRLPLPPLVLVPEDFEAPRIVHLRIPAPKHTTLTLRNVAGLLRGRDPRAAAEAVLVSAHLDHLGREDGGGDPIFNGADDDASGVAALLAIADACAALRQRPRRSILFVAFTAEERGLVGSRAFVRRPAWPLDRIVAQMNLEMLGRPEQGARGKVWMTGWRRSDLGPKLVPYFAKAGVELFEHPRLSAMLYGASDNAPFARAGVVAHSFSAGSLHGDYHRPSDEWQKLDYDHMARVVRGLFAGVLALAEGALTPRARD